MAGIEDYRTQQEVAQAREQDAHATQVLSEAIDAGAHLIVAMRLDEPQDVIELWTDKLWDGLRDHLDDEERLCAIVILLGERMEAEAGRIAGSVPLDGESR